MYTIQRGDPRKKITYIPAAIIYSQVVEARQSSSITTQ